jgi:hypothetical protein
VQGVLPAFKQAQKGPVFLCAARALYTAAPRLCKVSELHGQQGIVPCKDKCFDVAFRQMVRNDQATRLTKAVAQHVLLAREADTPGKDPYFADRHGHALSVGTDGSVGSLG